MGHFGGPFEGLFRHRIAFEVRFFILDNLKFVNSFQHLFRIPTLGQQAGVAEVGDFYVSVSRSDQMVGIPYLGFGGHRCGNMLQTVPKQ